MWYIPISNQALTKALDLTELEANIATWVKETSVCQLNRVNCHFQYLIRVELYFFLVKLKEESGRTLKQLLQN